VSVPERDDAPLPDDGLDKEALDALRAAYHALPPPPPVRELSEEDATTRAAVAWMAAAFAALPVPACPVPATARPAAPAPAARSAAWSAARTARRFAAAAALLALLLGAAFWLATLRPAPDTPPAPVVVAPRADGTPPAEPRLATAVVAAAPDRLELTSGPVRLLLFTESFEPAPEIPR
jgi:hypothetical protein